MTTVTGMRRGRETASKPGGCKASANLLGSSSEKNRRVFERRKFSRRGERVHGDMNVGDILYSYYFVCLDDH